MIYRFGSFELDLDEQQLRDNGRAVRLQRKTFEVLRYLVQTHGRVVSKQDLLQAVWPREYVSDVSVHRNISQLRRLLGQRGRAGTPIETVHGRGYRFRSAVEVSSEPSAPSGTAHATPSSREIDPFVGRESVLVRLLDALRDDPADGARSFLLTGEPGIGKTRCAEQFARHARERGATVWKGRASGAEGEPPLWPWIQVVRTALREATWDAATRESGERLLSRLGADLTPAPDGEAANPQAAFSLLDELTRLLLTPDRASAVAPRVIWIDDLPRNDRMTFRIIDMLSVPTQGVHVVVIATLRTDPAEPVRATLEGAPTQLQRIPLRGLSREDVARYIQLSTGIESVDLLARRIHQKTAGNPLFVREMLRFLVTTYGTENLPGVDLDEVSLPAAVHELVGQRLRGLHEQTREVLELASVLGASFDLPPLERASGFSRERLLQTLDEAIHSSLIQRSPDGPGYAFTHGLMRDALYHSLPSKRLCELHLRAGEALEGHGADSADLAELTRHFYRALPEGSPRRVQRYAVEAARMVARSGAYDAADRFLTWALEAQTFEPEFNPRKRCTLLLSAAITEHASGNARSVRRRLTEMIELASLHGYPDILALGGLLLRPMAVTSCPKPDPLARRALDAAMVLLPEHARTLRSRVLSRLSWTPPYSYDRTQRLEMSRRASELADPSDPRSELDSIVARQLALSAPEDLEEALRGNDDLLPFTQRRPTSNSAMEAHFYRMQTFLRAGDMDSAADAMARFGRVARELRFSEATWIHDRLDLQASFYDANFERVESRLREIHDRSHRLSIRFGDAYARACEAQLERERGVGLDPPIRYGRRRSPGESGTHRAHARAIREAAEGDGLALARTELRRFARSQFADLPRDGTLLATLCEITLACWRLQTREYAEALYHELRHYTHHNVLDEFLFSWGSAAHYAGLLASLLGNRHSAIQHFEAAVEMNERIGHRPQLARSRLALANALLEEPGRATRARAVDLLRALHAEARELGLLTTRRGCEAALLKAGQAPDPSTTERDAD